MPFIAFHKVLYVQYDGSNGSEVFTFLGANFTRPGDLGWSVISESAGVLTLRYDVDVSEWSYYVMLEDQYAVGKQGATATDVAFVDDVDFLEQYELLENLGIEGPAGPAGPTGATGPTGPTGPLPDLASGAGNVPAMLAGAEQDITVAVAPALSGTPTQATAVLTAGGGLLGGVSVLSITPLTATSVKVRVKNTSGLISSAGVVIVNAMA